MQEFIKGALILFAYFGILASILLILRKLIKIPDELFRKLLHYTMQGSYLLFVTAFVNWWHSALFGFLIVAVAYPIFAVLGRTENFSAFMTERKKGEFCSSLVITFVMLALCNAVCWGWLGDRYFGVACMYAWGIGDGFAALIGKQFGRHKIRLKYADHKKSAEGSIAMFVTSSIAVVTVLLLCGQAGVPACIVVGLTGAGAATVVELYAPDGKDTMLCPLAAMAVMIPLMMLFGGFA